MLSVQMPLSVFAQEKLWDDLQEAAITCYQNKHYAEAVENQRRALIVAEETFGPEDLKVVESLDNLAVYTQALGKNEDAEKMYDRALSIIEKRLPPDDQYRLTFTSYVAGFYKKIGRDQKAEELYGEVDKIRFGAKAE